MSHEAKHTCYVQPQGYGYTAVCEACSWMSGDYSDREDAERDGEMHERRERHPWEVPLGEIRNGRPISGPFIGT